MARSIKIINLSRSPLRIGVKNIAPAKGNPAGTAVDLDDGKVRRDLRRFAGDYMAVTGAEPEAAIADLTVAPTAADINTILAALRAEGIINP